MRQDAPLPWSDLDCALAICSDDEIDEIAWLSSAFCCCVIRKTDQDVQVRHRWGRSEEAMANSPLLELFSLTEG
jgi:hypothetical protein